MFISHQKKFIFIHVPRTGGTSISRALLSALGGRRKRWDINKKTKHETLGDFYMRINRMRTTVWGRKRPGFEAYYKFGFVRNPWDRTTSLYFYLRDSQIRKEIRQIESFEHFVFEIKNRNEWIMGLHSLRPQYHFFVNDKGEFEADFVGRFERFNEDFESVSRILELNCGLPHLNRSNHQSYREYYTEGMKSIIEEVFEQDILHFEYAF